MADSFHQENYAQAWEGANVGSYFGNRLVVSVAATVLGVVAAAFASDPIARIPFRGNGVVLSAVLLGLMVPWMVTFIPLHLSTTAPGHESPSRSTSEATDSVYHMRGPRQAGSQAELHVFAGAIRGYPSMSPQAAVSRDERRARAV